MSSIKQVILPDLGDFEDIPVVEILVSIGDQVALDDPLVMLESDKATMEVPAPFAGEITEITVKIGSTLSVGDPILSMSVAVDSSSDEPVSKDQVSKPKEMETKPTASKEPEPVKLSPSQDLVLRVKSVADTHQPAYASPSVRKYSRALGVDLNAINGSGDKGRILHEDVQNFVKAALSRGPSNGAGLDLLPWPTPNYERFGPIERRPLSRIQKVSGANLARNSIVIPHVTNFDEADITKTENFRKELNVEFKVDGPKIILLAFMIKVSANALKTYPRFNVSLDGDELVQKKYIHVGFAVDTPNGLVVAVIRDCDQKGLVEISQDIAGLANKARDGKLSPTDMSGGCFTISSVGNIGGTGFSPIINAPEVAILGAARSAIKPVWDGTAFQPRLIQPISLAWDHRVIDGAAATIFLAHIAKTLTNFQRTSL